jgi:hypothetical protein
VIPVPIPDDCVPAGCVRKVIGPPDGDPTGDIRPVETVIGVVDGEMRIAVLVELEDGDLERLQHTPAIWLTMVGNHLHPFSMHIADGDEWGTDAGAGGS